MNFNYFASTLALLIPELSFTSLSTGTISDSQLWLQFEIVIRY